MVCTPLPLLLALLVRSVAFSLRPITRNVFPIFSVAKNKNALRNVTKHFANANFMITYNNKNSSTLKVHPPFGVNLHNLYSLVNGKLCSYQCNRHCNATALDCFITKRSSITGFKVFKFDKLR